MPQLGLLNNWMLRSLKRGMPLLVTAILFGWIAAHHLEQFERQRTDRDLRVNAFLIAQWAKSLRSDGPRQRQVDAAVVAPPDSRVTLLDDRGMVLADSVGEPSAMDNHAMRPEIIAARSGTEASFVHYSQTTGDSMLYFARKVDSRDSPIAFVRVAFPLQHSKASLQSLEYSLWGSTVIATAGVLLLSGFLSTMLARFNNAMAASGHALEATTTITLRTANQAPLASPTSLQRQPGLEHLLAACDARTRMSLAAIRACAETLLAGPCSNLQHYFLSQIRRESVRLHSIIRDMLLLTQARAGTAVSHSEIVRLEHVVRDRLNRFRRRARLKGVSLALRDGCYSRSISSAHEPIFLGQPVAVRSRRQWVRTIVDRLIDNAITCTEVGGLIELRIHEQDGRAALEVRNSGAPIPKSFIPKAFDPLVFLHGVRNRPSYKAGLGLTVVKELAEALGGSVKASSGAGGGVTIIVYLPAVI